MDADPSLVSPRGWCRPSVTSHQSAANSTTRWRVAHRDRTRNNTRRLSIKRDPNRNRRSSWSRPLRTMGVGLAGWTSHLAADINPTRRHPARPSPDQRRRVVPTSFHRQTDFVCLMMMWRTAMVFLPCKALKEFPHQPFYFGNCQCPTSILPFSVTVHYGRATCQNHHVIYEAFATVSLSCWASHSYLFRWVLHFLARQRMRCCVDTRQRC